MLCRGHREINPHFKENQGLPGAAGSWSLSNLAPRMLAGNFEPGFYVKQFIKDMAMAADSANRLALDTPGLDLALSLYRKLAGQGHEADGTQALCRLYE